MKKLLYISISLIFLIFACKKTTKPKSTIALEDGPDATAPVITLKGFASYTFSLDGYVDPGFTATDDRDGDINNKVEITGSVTSSVVGTYTLAYNVKDAAGNKAETKTRTFLIKNSADYLVGNYNATCTCYQYTSDVQVPPDISTETFTTSLITSINTNNLIRINCLYTSDFKVQFPSLINRFGALSGTISPDHKTISLNTSEGGTSSGQIQKDCSYTFTKF